MFGFGKLIDILKIMRPVLLKWMKKNGVNDVNYTING